MSAGAGLLGETRRRLPGPTVAEIMDANGGAGPGFDVLRLALALAIILLHSFHVAQGIDSISATGWSGPIWAMALPVFFGLSGFLVTGSALRARSLRVFLAFRVLRILPALAVEITLSALVLGPLLTVLPLPDYVADPRFRRYFGNIVGWIHFELPGVFLDNPRPGIVNQSLWTLHPELMSYALMAALIATGAVYRRGAMTALWLVATIALFAYDTVRGLYADKVLIYFFLTGIVVYHWRGAIVVNGYAAAAAAVLSYVLLGISYHALIPLSLVVCYLMVFVGMQRFPSSRLVEGGDYSYGLYLYAFPVQQTIVQLLPELRHWWVVFPLAVVVTYAVAWVSWTVIEKPTLRLKRFVPRAPPRIASTTEPPALPDPPVPASPVSPASGIRP